jgi:hypothetical protein
MKIIFFCGHREHGEDQLGRLYTVDPEVINYTYSIPVPSMFSPYFDKYESRPCQYVNLQFFGQKSAG